MHKKLSEIKGFESCDNYIIFDNGMIYSENSNKFLKPLVDTKGYLYIDLRKKNALLKCPKIHKLVMLAFSGDEPKEQINHIDGDKQNNDISNLEYVTNKENRIHAIENGLINSINYGIAQYDLNGDLIAVYDTAKQALSAIGENEEYSGNIGRVVRGERATSYGYIWKQYEGSTTIER